MKHPEEIQHYINILTAKKEKLAERKKEKLAERKKGYIRDFKIPDNECYDYNLQIGILNAKIEGLNWAMRDF